MARVNNWDSQSRGFLTPQPSCKSRPRNSPAIPMSERKWSSPPMNKGDDFHVIHKVPAGDSPYVKAKQVQLIEKDPSRAISLFWAAINAGDRVDSALKDMAIVMKQLNRADEAIEAIKSFRHLCPHDAQGSLDNVLLELYKRSGRVEEEIEMLQRKLKNIEEGTIFCGKRTKIARSQGKKIQITVEQEKSRILGNLAWAYLRLNNYATAEELYRKALSLEPDKNKQCNLAICLMHMNQIAEAKSLLQAVKASSRVKELDESCTRSLERALQMLTELESGSVQSAENVDNLCFPQTAFADTWKRGSITENRSDSDMVSPACKNACPSPSFGRNVKASAEPRRRCSWGFNSRDQRRAIWENNAVGSSSQKLAPRIQETMNSLDKDGEKTELHTEPPTETILYEGRNQNYYTTVSGKEAIAENPKPDHDCLTGKSKKSWADMVEEEEALYGKIDFLGDLLQESSFFNDENQNSNITRQGGLKQLKKTGSSDRYSSSSLGMAKRALNFKDHSLMMSSEVESEPWKSTSHGGKNRLQVFQDITGPT